MLCYVFFKVVHSILLIEVDENDIITISHPVGFRADNTPINSTTNYSKGELIDRYNYLGLTKLPIDGILQLVTITETTLNYILKEILIEFPSKIPNKRKMDVETALSANSLEEIKISIIETILNEDVVSLWKKTKKHAGIDEEYFYQYFDNKEKGFAIKIKKSRKYRKPLCLREDFNLLPPQSFLYLS